MFGAPSDPFVTRCHLLCRVRTLLTGQISSGRFLRLHKIFQASAKRDSIAKAIPACDELVDNPRREILDSNDGYKRIHQKTQIIEYFTERVLKSAHI
jgi:hypothetical protein